LIDGDEKLVIDTTRYWLDVIGRVATRNIVRDAGLCGYRNRGQTRCRDYVSEMFNHLLRIKP